MNNIAFLLEEDVVVLLSLLGLSSLADDDVAVENVGEGVPSLGEGLGDFGAGPQEEVEQPDGGVGELLDGVDAVALAGDDLDGGAAVVDGDGGDLGGAEVAVAGLAVLELLGEVDPELEADVGPAVVVLAGHLGVDDAATGGHELEVAGVEGAGVACEVFVVDDSVEEICDCLLTTVGADLRKPGQSLICQK